MLQCFLFGETQFLVDGEALDPRPPQKTQLLFCYLLLHRDRRHPRDVLITTLWPDRDEQSARRCLSTTLWRLRRALHEDRQAITALLISGDTIGFNRQYPHWLDVAIFEQTCLAVQQIPGRDLSPVQAKGLQSAVDLYRGDLMEGHYDDWCLVERERLAGLHLQALGKLMSYHRHRGEVAQAITYGQRILAIDPLYEHVHRELMRLHYEAGNRAAALRQYDQCRALLAAELGIQPMPETTQLYQDIRNGMSTATQPTRPQTGEYPLALRSEMATDPTLYHALVHLRECQAQLNHATRQLERAVDTMERLIRQRTPAPEQSPHPHHSP